MTQGSDDSDRVANKSLFPSCCCDEAPEAGASALPDAGPGMAGPTCGSGGQRVRQRRGPRPHAPPRRGARGRRVRQRGELTPPVRVAPESSPARRRSFPLLSRVKDTKLSFFKQHLTFFSVRFPLITSSHKCLPH